MKISSGSETANFKWHQHIGDLLKNTFNFLQILISLFLSLRAPWSFFNAKSGSMSTVIHNPSTAQDIERDFWNSEVPVQGTKRIKAIIQDADGS